MANFKIGDVVRLKSGGPDMTVVRYEEPISLPTFESIMGRRTTVKEEVKVEATTVVCSWFGPKDKLEYGKFHEDQLELVMR